MLQKELEVISTFYHNFRHNFRHKEKNNKKNTQVGGIGNQHLPLALYITILSKFSNLRHKTPYVPKIFAALL